MTSDRPGKPELLAPAGSLDVFVTAVDEGADAVYVGAPQLNARNLAKHFSPEELAAMIDYGHRAGVKVYLAMNSLLKQQEIAKLIDLLCLLEQLAPDALIIQDLGLYYLIRTHFPSFVLHASTLMGAHNSLAVRQFADMGFARVVLAREVTLAEAESIHAQCPVELEMFVHGALCFSYSGLCLLSSYLGGKSSLRGRCVQPCRRKYSWGGAAAGQLPGYFFSMNDLEAIEFLPRLRRAGISSLKIEGRMRSQSYVGAVVRAYRKVLDAGDDIAAVLPEARALLKQAMGREACSGYFLSPRPAEIITPYTSGNIGHALGRVMEVQGDRLLLVLEEELEQGDRVRLHREESGDRASFTVRDIVGTAGAMQPCGAVGEQIWVVLHGAGAMPGDQLYKVDVRDRRRLESRASRLTPPARFRSVIEKMRKNDKGRKVSRSLGLEQGGYGQVANDRKRERQAKNAGRRLFRRFWLRGDGRVLDQSLLDRPERLIITLDRESVALLQGKKMRHRMEQVTIALPPVILEGDLPWYRQQVAGMLKKGARQWMIGHIGQLLLFGGVGGRGGRGTLRLAGDYTLNVLNSLALDFLRSQGVSAQQLSIESDRTTVQAMCAAKGKMETGLTVYARPALFTARAQPDFFQFNTPFVSPRGERFLLQRKWGQTLAVAQAPFSLLSSLDQLQRAGVDFFVVDLSNISLQKKEMALLRRQMASRGAGRGTEHFNFFRVLQ